jgi:putative ABC transport system substrate-binding protein
MLGITRREFIGLLGGAAAWPLTARAQQTTLPVIGLLVSSTAEAFSPSLTAFRQGLLETGYIEGRSVRFEYRFADDRLDRLPALAADLVRARVSLIAALGNQRPALAAKAATSAIPIVFAFGADPLENGVVSSLNRPGGNITGMTALDGALVSKRLQLLHDLLPSAKVFGILRNPTNNTQRLIDQSQAAVIALGRTMEIADARSEGELESAFAVLAQKRIDVISVLPDSLFVAHPEKLVELAAQYGMPAIYPFKEIARLGGLMSYGADMTDNIRQAGVYAGRILKGEKAGELPVQQASRFEFFINLKTAKSLGLAVPPTLLAIADGVIE